MAGMLGVAHIAQSRILPPEILSEVFETLTETGVHFGHPISGVSRQWRAVALRTPSLWTAIKYTTPWSLQTFSLLLERSKDCLIALKLVFTPTSKKTSKALDVPEDFDTYLAATLVPHIMRLKRLTIIYGDSRTQDIIREVAISLYHIPAPALREISARRVVKGPSEMESFLSPHNTPNLRSLHVNGIDTYGASAIDSDDPSSTTTFSSVRELALALKPRSSSPYRTWNSLNHYVLDLCPNITSLILDAATCTPLTSIAGSIDPPNDLNKLESLFVVCSSAGGLYNWVRFAQGYLLTTVNIRALSISYIDGDEDVLIDFFYEIRHLNIYARVRDLAFIGPDCPPSGSGNVYCLHSICGAFDRVTNLALCGVSASATVLRFLFDLTPVVRRGEPEGYVPTIFRNLECLVLISRTVDLDLAIVREIVQLRRQWICPLKKLRLGVSPECKERTADNWQWLASNIELSEISEEEQCRLRLKHVTSVDEVVDLRN